MKVKCFYYLVAAGLLVLICANTNWGGVALDEKFDTDLNKWVVLDEPNHPELGQTVNVELTGGGSLQVDCNNNERFRYQGVQSKERYTLPVGGKLVIDFYGNNADTGTSWMYPGSTHSHPLWTVASFDSNTGCVSTWRASYFSVKGKDAYYGDWVMWEGPSGEVPGGYVDIEVLNTAVPPIPYTISLTAQGFKHVIMAIDANNINVYIENDYYENLSSPTALYSVTTSSVFTSAELTSGLYVYALAARYTDWYHSTVGERFDGVKVTRVGATAPMNCDEARDMGYVANINADVNRDCRYDFEDFALIAEDWMECVDPANVNCAKPWL
ncbi:MAG: hypothetical protein ACYC54_11665 [Sedimentisphaerales bacterium]